MAHDSPVRADGRAAGQEVHSTVYRGSRLIARVVQRLEIRVSESLLDSDPVLGVEGQHLLEHVDRMRVRARVNLREPAEHWGDTRFECCQY